MRFSPGCNCCEGVPVAGTCHAEIPGTLLATFTAVGPGCACADGATVTLTYQGVFSGAHRWSGSAALGSCGHTITLTLNTSTTGSSSGCTWNYVAGCATGPTCGAGTSSTDPDPFHMQLFLGGTGGCAFSGCGCSLPDPGADSLVVDVTPP